MTTATNADARAPRVGDTVKWEDLPSGAVGYCAKYRRSVMRVDATGWWLNYQYTGEGIAWTFGNDGRPWAWDSASHRGGDTLVIKALGVSPDASLEELLRAVAANATKPGDVIAWADVPDGCAVRTAAGYVGLRHGDEGDLVATLENTVPSRWRATWSPWAGDEHRADGKPVTVIAVGITREESSDATTLRNALFPARPVAVGDEIKWEDVPDGAAVADLEGASNMAIKIGGRGCWVAYKRGFVRAYEDSSAFAWGANDANKKKRVEVLALNVDVAELRDATKCKQFVVRVAGDRMPWATETAKSATVHSVGDAVGWDDVPDGAMVQRAGDLMTYVRVGGKGGVVRDSMGGWMYMAASPSWEWSRYKHEAKDKPVTIVALGITAGARRTAEEVAALVAPVVRPGACLEWDAVPEGAVVRAHSGKVFARISGGGKALYRGGAAGAAKSMWDDLPAKATWEWARNKSGADGQTVEVLAVGVTGPKSGDQVKAICGLVANASRAPVRGDMIEWNDVPDGCIVQRDDGVAYVRTPGDHGEVVRGVGCTTWSSMGVGGWWAWTKHAGEARGKPVKVLAVGVVGPKTAEEVTAIVAAAPAAAVSCAVGDLIAWRDVPDGALACCTTSGGSCGIAAKHNGHGCWVGTRGMSEAPSFYDTGLAWSEGLRGFAWGDAEYNTHGDPMKILALGGERSDFASREKLQALFDRGRIAAQTATASPKVGDVVAWRDVQDGWIVQAEDGCAWVRLKGGGEPIRGSGGSSWINIDYAGGMWPWANKRDVARVTIVAMGVTGRMTGAEVAHLVATTAGGGAIGDAIAWDVVPVGGLVRYAAAVAAPALPAGVEAGVEAGMWIAWEAVPEGTIVRGVYTKGAAMFALRLRDRRCWVRCAGAQQIGALDGGAWGGRGDAPDWCTGPLLVLATGVAVDTYEAARAIADKVMARELIAGRWAAGAPADVRGRLVKRSCVGPGALVINGSDNPILRRMDGKGTTCDPARKIDPGGGYPWSESDGVVEVLAENLTEAECLEAVKVRTAAEAHAWAAARAARIAADGRAIA